MRRVGILIAGVTLLAACSRQVIETIAGGEVLSRAEVLASISNWPEKSQQAARYMIDKYGVPSEQTATTLVWYAAGPWKRSILYKEEVPHSFPKPHTDLLEQFIDYRVPVDKYDELAEYDGSVIVERTKGEISARCDKEAMNFLALNLAHEIVTGQRGVGSARVEYGRQAMAFMNNQSAPHTTGLHFPVPRGDCRPRPYHDSVAQPELSWWLVARDDVVARGGRSACGARAGKAHIARKATGIFADAPTEHHLHVLVVRDDLSVIPTAPTYAHASRPLAARWRSRRAARPLRAGGNEKLRTCKTSGPWLPFAVSGTTPSITTVAPAPALPIRSSIAGASGCAAKRIVVPTPGCWTTRAPLSETRVPRSLTSAAFGVKPLSRITLRTRSTVTRLSDSKVTAARPRFKLTSTDWTPSIFWMATRTAWAQTAQSIPKMLWRNSRNWAWDALGNRKTAPSTARRRRMYPPSIMG